MPDFQFLRQTPPDVMRYLPQFLKKDEHFAKIQEALNMEHEKQRQAIIDIAKQFFVDTATWGLSSWERVYATNPPADADITLRRALIKAKMAGAGVMTKIAVERLINMFTENGDAYINEDSGPGTFEIIFPSLVLYHPALKSVLEEMVPAHLLYYGRLVKYESGLPFTKFMGGAVSSHKKIKVKRGLAHDSTISLCTYSSFAVSVHKRIRIKPRTIKDTINKLNFIKYTTGSILLHKQVIIAQKGAEGYE